MIGSIHFLRMLRRAKVEPLEQAILAGQAFLLAEVRQQAEPSGSASLLP